MQQRVTQRVNSAYHIHRFSAINRRFQFIVLFLLEVDQKVVALPRNFVSVIIVTFQKLASMIVMVLKCGKINRPFDICFLFIDHQQMCDLVHQRRRKYLTVCG